jgi:hypothetical protein
MIEVQQSVEVIDESDFHYGDTGVVVRVDRRGEQPYEVLFTAPIDVHSHRYGERDIKSADRSEGA